MTPIVGILSDKFNTGIGKRTPWYLAGTLVVMPCFAGMWLYPKFINGPDAKESAQAAWYLILPALFNVGWASVQISHMSIVNQLSGSNRRRDELANNRNGFTAAANITVLGFALIFFLTVSNNIDQYRYLCIMVLGFGLTLSSFYFFTIKEVRMERDAIILEAKYQHAMKLSKGHEVEPLPDNDEQILVDMQSKDLGDSKQPKKSGKTAMSWLKDGNFYVHGMVYMLVRVSINVTMTMQPFYLEYVTGFKATDKLPTAPQIAIVPLISYIF